jgi:hypothetical protein
MARTRPNASWILTLCCGSLIGCGGGGMGGNPPQAPSATLTISPQPASIPVNGTVTFTSAVSGGNLNSPNWSLHAYAYADLGTPTTQIGGTTFVYTAPPTPPVYTGAAEFTTPGTVTLNAAQYNAADSITFTITAPTVTVALFPPTITVPLGGTQQFNGYAIGDVNNALIAKVNGVVGGSVATGTIAPTPNGFYGYYTYAAPAALPITGSQVTVTFLSQADATKSASAVVTLH